MTSPSNSPAVVDSPAAKSVQTAPPRKRRRRTAATGAAEDCFTCRKRQVKCDRRRPYCTQCLEIGKDCTGYRTTLTWGVGVASRGKLRGLSLPVVNSTKKAATSGEDIKSQNSPTASPSKVPVELSRPKIESSFGNDFQAADFGSPIYSPSNYHPTSPIPIPIAQVRQGWSVSGFNEHVEGYNNLIGKPTRLQIRPNPLRRIHTTGTASYEEAMFTTPTGSVSAFSDSDYPSPRDLPATPEDLGIPEPYVGSYSESYPCPPEQLQSVDAYGYHETPRSYPANAAFTTSAPSAVANSSSGYNMLPSSSSPTTFSDLLHCNDFTPTNEMVPQFPVPQKVDQDYFSDGFSDFSVSDPSSWLATLQPTFKPPGFSRLPPRMRSLLGAFDKAICPVLVARDDERNPYRMHIMRFVVSSPPLQNAVAALATSYLRLRGSGGHLDSSNCFGGPTTEELEFKSSAIELFNAALKNADAAADDSTFATLLVLCLMHLVDGGFGKFKTRVAGVKKLLARRASGAAIPDSDTIRWTGSWFTWFDVISCTVSDSEDQVRTEALKALDFSVYIGSLEHLASCDGRFFKLVARLQGFSPSSTLLSPAQDFYSLSSAKETGLEFNAQHNLWKPLLDVQARFGSWVSHPQFPATKADRLTVHHIGEAFRHAAAIYAERQLCPYVSASEQQMRGLVAPALSSLAAISVDSCINQFLLWPLLVVGTECVDSADRDVVRQRIATAAPSYFFASFTCAEVLEQLWSLADAGISGDSFSSYVRDSWPRLHALGVQAARWNDAMAVLENEYLFP